MSDPDRPEPVERVEAYLDGLLSGADRAAFARDAALDPALQAEVDRQRLIDASLKRLFSPPAGAETIARFSGTSSPGANGVAPLKLASAAAPPRKRKPIRAWPIAAAIMIGLTISWWLSGRNPAQDPNDYEDPGPVVGGPSQRALVDVYNEQVKAGFKPDWECRDRPRFVRTLEHRFGVPLVAEAPAGVSVWGLSYRTALSRSSVLLLARVDRENIIVFADRRTSSPDPPEPPPASGLHLHKREIRNVVLYELSRGTRPRILPLFRDLTPPDGPAPCPDKR